MNRMTHNKQRRGFTLVELLVVIVIIALLIGISAVATVRALKSAEVSATKFLMRSLSDGLEQFHTDFGYYPPLLRDDFTKNMPERSVLEVQPDAGDIQRSYRYFSMTSLPAYLVGVGRLEPTELTAGLDPDRHDGIAGPGIRDPGPDHSWGGALKREDNNPGKTGRVFGPYVDLAGDGGMRPASVADFGSDTGDNPRFPGVDSDGDLDQSMPIIVDAWGKPIRYYRPGWLTRSPTSGELTLDYAPLELVSVDAIEGGFKPELDLPLTNAPYFLLSSGPNRMFTAVKPASGGGDGVDLQFEPLSLTETNTMLIQDIDGQPGALKKMIKSIRDNIRVTP